MAVIGSYKLANPLATKRQLAATAVKQEHPGCIVYVLEHAERADITDLERFQVANEIRHGLRGLTVCEFLQQLRQRLGMRDGKAAEALFLMSTSTGELIPTSYWLGRVYDEYRDEDDGIVYLCYGRENVFGAAAV